MRRALLAASVVLAIASCGSSGGDKVSCSKDSECDTDEFCSNGVCTGRPDPCTSKADCDTDETCVNGNCQ